MAVHGSDFAGITDIDKNLSVTAGRFATAQAIARRWMTPRGTLFYDPNYGGGLLTFLNAPTTPTDQISHVLEAQALLDERILDATVDVTFESETGKLTIRGQLEEDDGPFALTLTASAMASDGTGTSFPAVELFVENL